MAELDPEPSVTASATAAAPSPPSEDLTPQPAQIDRTSFRTNLSDNRTDSPPVSLTTRLDARRNNHLLPLSVPHCTASSTSRSPHGRSRTHRTRLPTPPSANCKGVQPLRAGEGHSFLWRKLHSLSGIVPIGAFLVEHIVSNFETWNGPLAYAQQVKFLNALPLVRVLEWALIFIPLAFHALYGVFIAFRGRANVNVYPWAGNWMYLSQRVTGIIALALHHPARLAAALLRRLAPRAPRRRLPQGPGRALATPGCSPSTSSP